MDARLVGFCEQARDAACEMLDEAGVQSDAVMVVFVDGVDGDCDLHAGAAVIQHAVLDEIDPNIALLITAAAILSGLVDRLPEGKARTRAARALAALDANQRVLN